MILGLTGAIGGGKSTALSAFAAAGAEIHDADRLCHEFYRNPESELVRKLAARWGKRIFSATGEVDRRRIGAIVFTDQAELDFLTGLIYPELERQMTAAIAAARRRPEIVTVWEVPLLFELGWESVFDAIAVVWTEPALRRLRLQARGLTDEEILRREARQWPAERKLEQADYALINNGSAIYLQMQCTELLNNLNRKV